ncbi:MAG: nucleotidyltransferase [Euryarchaeota archaeon CG_4_9_14_3_um_filter_38_12]|nr:MAG: nucleotidyltransferase [Euryarchaeota archaeon CG_4_9_14_3_um_filter_38_12]
MDRKNSIKRMLHGFKTKVNKDFPVYKMIFFGSRMQGKSHKDSDIDLIIVSDRFKRLNFIKRAAAMYDYWDLHYPVDFLCYTPEEFKKLSKQITIVREAVEEGVVI